MYRLDDPRLRKMTPPGQRVEGRLGDRYRWAETARASDVFVPVPDGTRARDVECAIGPGHVRVALAGGAALLEGPLAGRVDPSASSWALSQACPLAP